MKITFVNGYTVKDGTGTVYKPGDVLDCNQASADHFINRGVAVETANAPQTQEQPKKSKASNKASDDDASANSGGGKK